MSEDKESFVGYLKGSASYQGVKPKMLPNALKEFNLFLSEIWFHQQKKIEKAEAELKLFKQYYKESKEKLEFAVDAGVFGILPLLNSDLIKKIEEM